MIGFIVFVLFFFSKKFQYLLKSALITKHWISIIFSYLQSSASQMSHFTPSVRDTSPPGNTRSLPAQISPPSDCIYDNAPVRASSQRHAPPRRHPVNHAARPGQSHERFNVEDIEEDSPLVYASLNHTTPRGPVRVNLPEETSEYAAIRVS